MAVRRRPEVLTLALDRVDYLLDGRVRPMADVDKLHEAGIEYDGWLDFFADEVDWPALWTRHRAELMREWQRRGGTGQPWGATFDNTPVIKGQGDE